MHQRRGRGTAACLALASAAALALAGGTAVYLLDRPAGSAWLIPPAWQAASSAPWFGAAGPWLPSLTHAFAFSILTALVLPHTRGLVIAACLTWATIDTLAEIGQHAAVSAGVAAAITAAFDGAPLAQRIGRYFTHGSFDAADVAAGLAGAALAWLALRRWLPMPGGGSQSRAEPRTEPRTNSDSDSARLLPDPDPVARAGARPWSTH